MKPFPKCSLVTPTYNWPEALELLLRSAENQSYLPDELIIADDGSSSETEKLINEFQKKSTFPIIHLRHEDKGNRKAKILNKAIAKAKYEYIIEIDGDIIINKYFIEDHLRLSQKGFYLYGSRVNIRKDFLTKLFRNKNLGFNLFSTGIQKRTRTIRLPLITNFVKPVDVRSKKLRGCNMSFLREDFIKVNGFNENFQGWGMEDSEMIQRLHNIGIKGKRLKFSGIVYHIYHNEQSKSNVEKNLEIEKHTTQNKLTFIENGIDQYL